MQPPDALLKRGINELPCIGDGRQSGTSGSPSILNASPEAAAGGGLALVKTGDRIRIDLNKRTANILVSDDELAKRRADVKAKLGNGGLSYVPHSQTPWQEIQRQIVDQFDNGMVLKPAVKYRDVAHHEYPARQSLRASSHGGVGQCLTRRPASARCTSATGIFVMPNPWDAGTAKLLADFGFEAIATSSAALGVDAGEA